MQTAAGIFAAIAALIHLYIFVLESIRWTMPTTRKTFGLTESQAEQTKDMAYNQGFYNLFLAIITIIGLLMLGTDQGVGRALLFAATGSMLAAAVVLVTRDRSKARAAVVQGAAPLLAVVLLLLSL